MRTRLAVQGLTVASSMLAALVFAAGPGVAAPDSPPTAFAGSSASCSAEVSSAADAADVTVEVLSGSERNRAIATIISAVNSGEVELSQEVSPTLLRGAEVVRVADGPVIARVALDDEFSNLTLQLNGTSSVAHYAETHVTAIDDESGHVRALQDGVVTVDRIFHNSDAPGADVEEASGEFSTMDHKLGFWRALNRCLSNAGLPAWLVAFAMMACGSNPVGAVICLIGAGIGVGTAYFCVNWALKHR